MRLGIYVQTPFCQTKCTYCNFHTGVFASALYSRYAAAVCREIRGLSGPQEHRLDEPASLSTETRAPVDTVYFGGGTPSLLAPAALAEIMGAIRERFGDGFQEVTLEADPETITAEKAAAWQAAGFNRVSMGVQSFQDAELKTAGRMHRRSDVYTAVQILRDSGFGNISFDLIAGLPHQSDESWNDSVSRLLELHPEHTSIYILEIDEGSRLGQEVLAGGTRYSASAVPDDDAMANFYERACALLESAGYVHYEISNWALPGYESRHNLKYWRREPYYGFGAGAHSFDGRRRWANRHDPAAYADAVEEGNLCVEQLETISPEQALAEELFLGLRQLGGIDIAQIEARYGASLRARIEPLHERKLVEWQGNRLRLARDRLTVSNEVFVSLLD